MLEAKVFLDEGDRFGGKSTAELLLRLLMREGIAGASLYRAVMGYGEKHHLHMPQRFGTSDEGPLFLLFIDDDERVRRVLQMVREIIGAAGLIVVSHVEKG